MPIEWTKQTDRKHIVVRKSSAQYVHGDGSYPEEIKEEQGKRMGGLRHVAYKFRCATRANMTRTCRNIPAMPSICIKLSIYFHIRRAINDPPDSASLCVVAIAALEVRCEGVSTTVCMAF